jgi:hypothetical protein
MTLAMLATVAATGLVALQVIRVPGWRGYAGVVLLVVAVLSAAWAGTEVVP